jgi:hypothetical protein
MSEVPGELMHYTNAGGLHGIISSKSLWASHTSFMNDAEEIVGFYSRVLPMILRQELEQLVIDSEDFAEAVNAERRRGIDLIGNRVDTIVKGLEPLAKAQDYYVVSFCTATDEWISKNGLLSQWRGYGENGGYAIVFDTEKLESLLEAEGQIYYEEQLDRTDVEYNLIQISDIKVKEVVEYLGKLKTSIHARLRGKSTDDEDKDAAEILCKLSMLCKHRGFKEEKEVRIVVREPSPFNMGHDPQNQSGKPYRKVRSYIRNGVSVPCIHLFEDQKLDALPIRRVIVGPHSDKVDRKRAVELLLHEHNVDAEVLTSETPYCGKQTS